MALTRADRSPPDAAPSLGARVLAFTSIILAGACGGLIGYQVTDLSCDTGCTDTAGVIGLGSAVLAAVGVAVVAVLTLRATAEWRAAPAAGSLRSGTDVAPGLAKRPKAMTTHVLTVEDDERIRIALRLALEDEGWEVEEVESGEQALATFTRSPADVVLVDIMLPGIDGFDVCRSIRRCSDVPIVMITARSDTHDVVAGLEAGADDYLTKPFAPKELSARIRALLRRARACENGAALIVFDDLEILPDEGIVRVSGVDVHLTKTEFRLLVELGYNPGRIFSREMLLERVWGLGYFGDGRLVDVHVRRLRTKIETDPANPRHVVTVRGLGYKLQP